MLRIIQNPELLIYEGSYLLKKRIEVKHAKTLSRCFVFVGPGSPGVAYQNMKEYEPVAGIMQRFGQQWLARDYLESLGNRDRIRSEYHFASFIILTKSTFDFIAQLLNRILELGHVGKDIDLARAEFRKRIIANNKFPELGDTINRQTSWILEITKYRKAIEHQKTVPLTTINPDDIIAMNRGKLISIDFSDQPLLFHTVPLSFSELMSEAVRNRESKTARFKTKEVLPYCDLCLRKTRQIIEKTFEVACEKLQGSSAVKQNRQVRAQLIRSSREDIATDRLERLGSISDNTMKSYLMWKFPKRNLDVAADSSVLSNLLKELENAKIRNYEGLDKAIDDNMEWFIDYEFSHPPFVPLSWVKPREAMKREYDAIGVVSSILQKILREKRGSPHH